MNTENIFGRKRPRRDKATGEIVEMIDSPVCAVTNAVLDGSFGPDRGKKLVVSLEAGDLIVIRPFKTTRAEKMSAHDIYRVMIKCRANLLALAKARESKQKKAAKRIASQLRRGQQQKGRE